MGGLFLLAESSTSQIGIVHLIGLGVTIASSVGGAVYGGARWLGRHIDTLGAERRAERERDAQTIETVRSDFLAHLARRDAAAGTRDDMFAKALATQEAECAHARAEDRSLRRDELKIILRVAGIPFPGDTGKFQTPGGSKEKTT